MGVVGLVEVRVPMELVCDVYRVPLDRPKRGRWYSLVIVVERGRWLPKCMAKGVYINLPLVYEVNPSCRFKVKCLNCPNFTWEKRLTVFV